MKADFDTIAAAVALLINSAGMAALWTILERDETKELRDELSGQIKWILADPGYVKRRREKLYALPLPIWLVLLNVANLALLVGLGIVLILGPEQVFSLRSAADLAEPLSTAERVLYWIWYALLLIGYVIKGCIPTAELVKLYVDSGRWLRENAPRQKTAG